MSFLSGYKTYIAAIGLIGLGIYQASKGDIDTGVQSIIQGIAIITGRQAIAKIGSQQ